MDFVGYAALGGLERVAIVAGAVIIGYWGYRLYTAEKNAGLVFMGLAVVVLVGALATGSSHVKSVGESLQLATRPADAQTLPDALTAGSEDKAQQPSPFLEPGAGVAPAADKQPAADKAPAADEQSAADKQSATVAQSTAQESTDTGASSERTGPAADGVAANATVVRLATGQELGGRIVSVKSENVSLEWSEAER